MRSDEGTGPVRDHETSEAVPRRDRYHESRPCRNCGDPTTGTYCPSCGQKKVDYAVSVGAIVGDVIDDYVLLNPKLPRTLVALLFRPGHLTREFVAGRVVRYIRPFRLYLASSVVFFLVLSFFSVRVIQGVDVGADSAIPADSITAAARAEIDRAMADLDPGDRALVEDAIQRAVRRPVRDSLAGPGGEDSVGPGAGTGGDGPRVRVDNVRVHTLNASLDSLIEANIQGLMDMPPREAIRTVVRDYLEYFPTMVFLLMPVVAVLLKLLYIRRSRFYAEHFVFALHVHALAFALFTAMLLIRQPAAIALLLGWLMVYFFIAMKRFYGQGPLKTVLKFAVFGWAYFSIFVIAAALTMAVTLALI